MRLLLVRHAQTVWNAAGRVQGQADPPLSDMGWAQCDALAQRLAGHQVDAVFSSDLVRARLTADAVARATGLTPVLDPGLREVGLGRWEGIDRPTLARDYPELYARWVAAPTWDIVPEGEGGQAFRDRVVGTLCRLLHGQGPASTVVVVTHIGVIRLALSLAAGLEHLGLRWPWALDNTSITTLVGPPDPQRWQSPEMEVRVVNDAAHLAMAGVRG